MKKIFLALIIIMTSVAAVGAQGLAKKCSTIENVTTITITKSMLRLAAGAMNSGPVDIEGLVDKLDQVELVTVEDNAGIPAVKKVIKAYLSSKGGFEELLNITDSDQTVTLYMKSDSNGKNQYVILVDEKTEVTAMLLIGCLTPEDVSEFTDLNF